MKVAGGVRTAKDAIRYLVLVRETAGQEWLTPESFRIGASSLLNDLLMQRSKQLTGVYAGPDYFTSTNERSLGLRARARVTRRRFHPQEYGLFIDGRVHAVGGRRRSS